MTLVARLLLLLATRYAAVSGSELEQWSGGQQSQSCSNLNPVTIDPGAPLRYNIASSAETGAHINPWSQPCGQAWKITNMRDTWSNVKFEVTIAQPQTGVGFDFSVCNPCISQDTDVTSAEYLMLLQTVGVSLQSARQYWGQVQERGEWCSTECI